jgi:hypothetical protein
MAMGKFEKLIFGKGVGPEDGCDQIVTSFGILRVCHEPRIASLELRFGFFL